MEIPYRDYLRYNPETGHFFWIKERKNISVGDVAGTIDFDGYVIIRLFNKSVRAHRLAFLFMTGKFPEKQVDHINRLRDDNRWNNLREVTALENSHNNNAKGFYKRDTDKFESSFMFRGTKHYLGVFSSEEEAHKQYLIKKESLYGSFRRV